jgi:hypothetical protein
MPAFAGMTNALHSMAGAGVQKMSSELKTVLQPG